MGIQINGATDSITAIDGTIDVVSAIGNAGVVTATAFVGNITGNVTGNINHASNLELQVGGVTRGKFDSSGRLLIGTTNPSAKLVVSNDGANGFEFNPNFNSNNSIIASYNRTGGGSYSQLTLSASQHIFAQGGTEYARFSASGRLGIGTDNPSGKLDIVTGSLGGNVLIDAESSSGYHAKIVNDSGDLTLGSRNTSADTKLTSKRDVIILTGSSEVEKLRITSAGRILIATTTEGHSNADDLTIATAAGSLGNTGITIRSSTTGDGNIFFSDATSGDGETKGVIKYAHNTDHMQFNTAGSERVRIDSSGRMLLGTVRTYGTGPYYDDICINNSNGSGSAGGAGIDLISKSNNYGAIVFSNESQHERGYIKFEHNSGVNKLRFGTLGTDRWEILSTGHFYPSTNDVFDIGSNSLKVRNVSIAGTMTSGRATITGTTIAVRNSGVSTATGSIIYNSNLNSLEFYNGSEWKAISYKASSFNVNYLVVGGGGGGGGYYRGGGGGAGALRTNMSGNAQGGGQSTAPAKSISIGIAYSIILGAGGAGAYNSAGNAGGTTTFDDIVSNGGTGGARYERDAPTNSGNGSGGGGGGHTGTSRSGGAGGTYGYAGGNGSNSGSTQCGGGGGGAAAQGQSGGGGGTDGDGGAALTNTITGSTVAYAGGAGGGNYGGGNQTIGGGAGAAAGAVGSSGAPGIDASIPNRGSGGGGAGGSNVSGGTGSAGVIILRFPTTYTATVTGGVTSSSTTVGTDTVLTITATSDSSQTVTFA